jgi:hypothetical protein
MLYKREDLIYNVVERIKQHKGEMSYFDMGKALRCETDMSSWCQAIMFIEMSVICHNIPYYVNNERRIREVYEAFRDAITFYNANKDESEIVIQSSEKTWTDIMSAYTLPRLKLGDDTHKVFKSGSGKSQADLCDEQGIGFEVKRNYRNGSRSSLHTATAKYLIDCKNTTIEVRAIDACGNVDLESYPLGRFNGFLSSKIITPTTCIEEELLQLIYSGELIPEIEKRLQEDGFCWNP